MQRSLGAAALSIRRNIETKNCKIIATDNSAAMIERCQRNVHAYKANTPVEIIKGDILDINIQNTSMVVLNFTLQFILNVLQDASTYPAEDTNSKPLSRSCRAS